MSIGHGGQILLSEATAALTRDGLPDRVTLDDLGAHRLKDLTRPERVFQLLAPDLPTETRPLASLDARPHNLPTHPTPLIGRKEVAVAVEALLLRDDVRQVTLTGPGGTGKTRLSLQVAADLLDRFEHGAFFIDLAPISDPALVVSTIAQTLGVSDSAGRPRLDVLADALRSRQMLLVLDNFEQVLSNATDVSELLRACPRLTILVTSRAALQIRGEHEYPVPALSLPTAGQSTTPAALSQYAAVTLFIERAVAVKPDFAVTNENAPAVAEICIRLDGLPLAIELAAARIRLLTSQAILARLERRLALLTGGARDLPARQQTLRGTIASSYDLLDEAERRLYRRLGVFVGGCTLESAEAIGAMAGDQALNVLDGVTSLVAKSLLRQQEQPDGEPRFTMLETIREYALERLDERGEAADARRHHAEHYLLFMKEATPHLTRLEAATWLDRLQAEHDNLRAALAWSSESANLTDLMTRVVGPMWLFCLMRGHITEGRRWLDRALDLATDPLARTSVLVAAAWLASFQNDNVRQRVLWNEAISLGRSCGDLSSVALALARLGLLESHSGDWAQALAYCEESLDVSRPAGDPATIAYALISRGHLAQKQGDHDAAESSFTASLQQARKVGHVVWESHALNQWALTASARGDLDRSTALCDEALTLFRRYRDRWGELACGHTLMDIAQRRGDVQAADDWARVTLTVSLEDGIRRGALQSLSALAWVERTRGFPVRAVRLLGAIEALLEALGRRRSAGEQEDYEAEATLLRSALSEDAFTATWAEGKAMTLEQAAAYALEAPTSG